MGCERPASASHDDIGDSQGEARPGAEAMTCATSDVAARADAGVASPTATLSSHRLLVPGFVSMRELAAKERTGLDGGKPSALTEADLEQIRRIRALSAENSTPAVVVPGLLLGGSATACDWDCFQEHGITHVVNACPSLPNFFLCRGIHYHRVDIEDVPEADLAGQLPAALDFIESALAAGGIVLVHCHAGVSRSVAVTSAYLILKKGMTFEQSMETIWKVRQQARPNMGFALHLRSLEKHQPGSDKAPPRRSWSRRSKDLRK
ncbi:unnamed protein product [Pedinophyceae sp. YPF-701]|nr:unnamed protein product [Pedinophyceae sp. YPF-701]